ncbi:phosphate-starvation-inducible protein PsiE [Serratia plymuthica]|nr:phosphate-starvation-inducible protein PsiE [Serratia plymuthica]
MAKTSRSIMIAKGLQRVLNVGLLLLAAILIVFLVKETIHLGESLVCKQRGIIVLSVD